MLGGGEVGGVGTGDLFGVGLDGAHGFFGDVAVLCVFFIDSGVDPRHTVDFETPDSPPSSDQVVDLAGQGTGRVVGHSSYLTEPCRLSGGSQARLANNDPTEPWEP